MIDFLMNPWPWWFSGMMIALVMFLLLWAGGEFGVSSNLRTMCSVAGAGKFSDFFKFDWKAQQWNLVFIAGTVLGGFIAHQFMNTHEPIALSPYTQENLSQYALTVGDELVPTEIFNWEAVFTPRGFLVMVVGGFLIGFGSRYAGGCTSGHAISGISNLQLPSLIAVIGFFIGGLIMTWLILPYILTL